MAKSGNTPAKNKIANGVRAALQEPASQQVQFGAQVYQGPIPHPDILRAFDELVPGSAKQLMEEVKIEAAHRRSHETKAMEANIAVQNKQLEMTHYQGRVVFISDTLGQIAGVIVSLSCVAGAVWLSLNHHDWVAAALAAIPTAAVIKAFFTHRPPPKPS